MAFSSASAPSRRRASAAAIVDWSRSGAVGKASSTAAWASGRSRFASVIAADSRRLDRSELLSSSSRSKRQALGGIDRRDRRQGLDAPGLGQVAAAGNLLEGGDELGELEIAGGLDAQADLVGIARRQQLPAQAGQASLRTSASSGSPRSWVPCWIIRNRASRSAGLRSWALTITSTSSAAEPLAPCRATWWT